jgi:hypothetical protein
MALQFQQPNIDPAAQLREDRRNVMNTLASIPSVVLQYKQFQKNSELAELEHQLKAKGLQAQLREIEAKYGTGAEAPSVSSGVRSAGPGSTLAASAMLDPLGHTETTALPETEEDRLKRLGTERYGLLMPGGENQDKMFGQLNQLRGQYLGQSKDFATIRASFGRIKATAQNPSPAGDLSLIFNYMKMLDPNSVVRESEFQNAATAAPLLTRLGLDWEKLSGVWRGERMTPAMRKDFLQQSNALFTSSADNQKGLVKEFRRIAEKSGLDPDLAIVDFLSGEQDMSQVAGPPATETEEGPPAPPTTPATPATTGEPPEVNNQAAYDALPPGTVYRTPDGRTLRKR